MPSLIRRPKLTHLSTLFRTLWILREKEFYKEMLIVETITKVCIAYI